jgi:hypothetical protein
MASRACRALPRQMRYNIHRRTHHLVSGTLAISTLRRLQ